jgi:hypothetical protein
LALTVAWNPVCADAAAVNARLSATTTPGNTIRRRANTPHIPCFDPEFMTPLCAWPYDVRVVTTVCPQLSARDTSLVS